MQTPNTNQNFRSDDPVWILLADFSFNDFLSAQDRRDEPLAGILFQKLRELGMSSQSMENIGRPLARFAKETLARYQQERLALSGQIRIFCQKKILDDINLVKPSGPDHTAQGKKQKQSFPDAGANMIGGWGYFIIERGEDLLPDSFTTPHNNIDLYLYKEGE